MWAQKEEMVEETYVNANDKSPSQNQEGILNLNSDIFEYCCFKDQDDLLMLYPAQNHFIEEYDPEDQYEIQDHDITASGNNQLNKANDQKKSEENTSH